MRVIGTAGHVDHGKSTLVLALTGIDPDRLKEEKAREMTIDLGFAGMTLPGVSSEPERVGIIDVPGHIGASGEPERVGIIDGPGHIGASGEPERVGIIDVPGHIGVRGEPERVGIIDVPGHIDFIKNMLAGVGGIDAALLVIAADEGVMPQTREHLAILDLLQVPGGVVALTKTDLVEDQDWLWLVQDEIRELLQTTVLRGAPIVPVSARRREGLGALRHALATTLAQIPPRTNRGRARLPVDRAFSMAGFGTVVTGTLLDGDLRLGDEVEILPAGLTARVRGLQAHKEKIETAHPGSRVAVNLSGVHPDQVPRGQTLSLPGTLHNSYLLDLRLHLLPRVAPLKHNQLVDFFSGAAEVPAYVRLLDSERLEPGSDGWVQVRLLEPLALLRGDHFIIRQPSPSHTLGGGLVVDPRPARRWRRMRADVIQRLETLSHGTPGDIWLQVLMRDEPATRRAVDERSGLPASSAGAAWHEVTARADLVVLGTQPSPGPDTLVMSRGGWSQVAAQLATVLDDYHRTYPLRAGMPRSELKSRLDQGRRTALTARAFADILARAEAENLLRVTESVVCRTGHQVTFSPAQERRVQQTLTLFHRQPFSPPGIDEARSTLGDDVLAALFEQGKLVKLNDDVALDAAAYQEMVDTIRQIIQQEGSVTVAQVRDRFDTSRKYALAILEYLDAQRVTRRVGDARVLRF